MKTFEEDWEEFCRFYEYDPDHTSEETFEYFREQWIKQHDTRNKRHDPPARAR